MIRFEKIRVFYRLMADFQFNIIKRGFLDVDIFQEDYTTFDAFIKRRRPSAVFMSTINGCTSVKSALSAISKLPTSVLFSEFERCGREELDLFDTNEDSALIVFILYCVEHNQVMEYTVDKMVRCALAQTVDDDSAFNTRVQIFIRDLMHFRDRI